MKNLICLLALATATTPLAISADQEATLLPRPLQLRFFAPPPAPPAEVNTATSLQSVNRPHASTRSLTANASLYSIGDPTDEEQLYLELINRARQDPAAEGRWLRDLSDPAIVGAYQFFNVDLDLMVQQFASINPAPPLAMNAKLIQAARLHSLDQLTNQFQGHLGTDGSTIGQRATAQGYAFQQIAENVFASSKFVLEGHAGFQVDWGEGPGGMQNPPGHRNTIHNPLFREAGIGIANGIVGDFGPQAVTQLFAVAPNAVPFVTGVAYYDLNGNSFYDLGEGIGGVEVEVAPSDFFSVSPTSGGYAVPVSGDGTYTVTFHVQGLDAFEQEIEITNLENFKSDLVLPYQAPAVTGPATPFLMQENSYSIASVGGAEAYQWQVNQLHPFSLALDAESDSPLISFDISEDHEPLSSHAAASGNRSFYLTHQNPPVDQFISLQPILRAGPSSRVSFKHQLGFATEFQTGQLQVSTDGGSTWATLWQIAGDGTAGSGTFTEETINFNAFDGEDLLVRFGYILKRQNGASFFSLDDNRIGLYLDDILLEGFQELAATSVAQVDSPTFSFIPSDTGTFELSASPIVSGRLFPRGPALTVNPVVAPDHFEVTLGPLRLEGDEVVLPFSVADAPANVLFVLEHASALPAPWSPDPLALITAINGSTQFEARSSRSGSSRFFRIKAIAP